MIGLGSDKNGHILPTGQWYAPSAVVNDALILHILHILHVLHNMHSLHKMHILHGAMYNSINRIVHSAENSVDKYFLIDTQVLSTQFPSESQVFSVHQSGAQVVSKLFPSRHQ